MANSNSETETNGTFLTLSRHPEYYIATADLSFLVEHVQFKVHRYFFERESTYFAGKLATPLSPGSPLQGSGDSNAIVLEELTPDEFARFLWVFYNPRYSLYEAEVEEWETILRLANRWAFPEVKSLAVRELEKKEMLDVRRIKLYQDTAVDRNFLITRYAALCEREAPLTLAEGVDLGMETALMIARGREEVRASRTASGVRSPLTPTVHGPDLHEVIRELFKIAPPGAEAEPEGTQPPPAVSAPVLSLQTKPPPTPTVTATPSTPTPKQQQQGKQQTGNKKGQNKKPTVTAPTPTKSTPKAETPTSPWAAKDTKAAKKAATNGAKDASATDEKAAGAMETAMTTTETTTETTTATTPTTTTEATAEEAAAPDTTSSLIDLSNGSTGTESQGANGSGSAKADLFSLDPLVTSSVFEATSWGQVKTGSIL